jgi:hypothetical protein
VLRVSAISRTESGHFGCVPVGRVPVRENHRHVEPCEAHHAVELPGLVHDLPTSLRRLNRCKGGTLGSVLRCVHIDHDDTGKLAGTLVVANRSSDGNVLTGRCPSMSD